MKRMALCFIAFICNTVYAQKDKISNWKYPIISGTITVQINSRPLATQFYETLKITPPIPAPFRLVVKADSSYTIHAKSKSFTYLNNTKKGLSSNYTLLRNTDSLSIHFITNVTADLPVTIAYAYAYNDSAQIVFDSNPQKCFDQLLQSCFTKFANLYATDKRAKAEDIEYPQGVFAPYRATKEAYGFKQYTGMALDSVAAKEACITLNKKVKDWLKAYKMTTIKYYDKPAFMAKSNYLHTEATEYTKTNAQGIVLFVVSVFNNVAQEGSYVGVRISDN